MVDHTPPALVEARVEAATRLRVVVEDADNPLRSAEVSVDAGEWQPASTSDGLIDARREEIVIPLDGLGDGGEAARANRGCCSCGSPTRPTM